MVNYIYALGTSTNSWEASLPMRFSAPILGVNIFSNSLFSLYSNLDFSFCMRINLIELNLIKFSALESLG